MQIVPPQDGTTSKRPFIIAAMVLLVAILALTGRLAYLQLFMWDHFKEVSEHNRIRLQDVPPTRGMIFDRHGVLLVDNQPSFDLTLVQEDVPDLSVLLHNLEQLLGLEKAYVTERLTKTKDAPPFEPVVIKSDLTWEDLAKIETYKYENPGLSISAEPRRHYLHPTLAAHVIGYTSQITERQLASGNLKDVRMGDRVGQYGVEQAWQENLSGSRGGRQVEVDATGRRLQVLQEIPALPGQNLFLTIDAQLQRAAEAALEAEAGAVVALDPNTGQVLAMVSRPAFDQSRFVRGLSGAEWGALVHDSLHPLENRALAGQYPPGSTFKMVTALAGLAEGVITPETTFNCPGFYHFGERDYGCWKKGGHGNVSLHRAIVESCDVYFYRVGQKLGVDRLAKMAVALGLGQPTGVGLNSEKPGLVPTSVWKKRRFGVPWQDGETLSVAIGQGFNLATPLQLASMVATVANGGTVWRPQVVLRVEDAEGRTIREFQPVKRAGLKVKPQDLKLVKDALAGVVNEPGGTGSRAKVEGVRVGGKTGTAQVVTLDRYKGIKDIHEIPYKYRDHALFVAFAPVDNPRIAVAVVAEHSGGGGAVAGPVAQKVLQAFFKGQAPVQVQVMAGPAAEE